MIQVGEALQAVDLHVEVYRLQCALLEAQGEDPAVLASNDMALPMLFRAHAKAALGTELTIMQARRQDLEGMKRWLSAEIERTNDR